MAQSLDQLSRIDISGYKSIKHCSIELKKTNVIIGSNGAGKSNFISIFALLQDILAKNLQVAVGQNGLNSLFYNGRKITEEIAAEVFFGKNSYGFNLIPTDDNRIIFKKEYFAYHGNYENESNISRGHSESMWQAGSRNKLDEYIKPILAKQNWRVYHFHDTGRNSRVKQEHNISNNLVLMSDGGNLAAFLHRLKHNYVKSYDEIVSTIQLIAPYFKDFVLEPQESNREQIILRWQQKGCEDIFNASQFSDGTLRFICLAVLLLQPHELQPAAIIIDEPELGLHPYAVTIFSEMAKQLPYEKQIVISTQSVELLSEFDAEDVIVADHSEEGSVFKRLDVEKLDTWLNSDYALGDLWKKSILGGRLSQ